MNSKINLDKYWNEAINALKSFNGSARYIGPVEFKYSGRPPNSSTVTANSIRECDLAVIHKGEIEKHDPTSLTQLVATWWAIFANDVFVIFSKSNSELIGGDAKHITSLKQQLALVLNRGIATPQSREVRENAYLGNNRVLTKTVFGHKLILDSRDLSLAPHIILDGYWEKWITNVFQSSVKEGMTVVDIGSNIGYYSLLAADAIGPNGKLVCFEANPSLSSIVFHNLCLNGFQDRSIVESKAVYSSSQKLQFKIYENYLGSSSLWGNDEQAEMYRDKLTTVEVDSISLDEYFSDDEIVDVIKIDAEGAEPFIIQGAEKLIQRNPNILIIMEFSPSAINHSLGSVVEFYNSIKSLGLNIMKINTDSTLTPMTLEELPKLTLTDVVLRRDDSQSLTQP